MRYDYVLLLVWVCLFLTLILFELTSSVIMRCLSVRPPESFVMHVLASTFLFTPLQPAAADLPSFLRRMAGPEVDAGSVHVCSWPSFLIPFEVCMCVPYPSSLIPFEVCVWVPLPSFLIPFKVCVYVPYPSFLIPFEVCVCVPYPSFLIPFEVCVYVP